MALLSVIRRWYHREGMAIREITRRTGLSRNTVRKYLAAGEIEPRYPKRHSVSKLDDYAQTLTNWLHRESRRKRKQRRSVKQLYSGLVELGYTGSYDRVAAFARDWRRQQQESVRSGKGAYVPLSFSPGEAFQFDWSEDYAVINGRSTKLQVAHFKLSHSRAFILRAYLLQTHEMLFDAHNHAFVALGGVPEHGIYDNMKTAVDRVRKGKVREVNIRFQAMVSHFLFEAEFCNPAAGWEKGQIEKNVQDARHRLWHQAPAFNDLEELNFWLEQRCKALWQELPHPEYKQRSIADLWEAERPFLMSATFANRPVSLRVYADRLVIVAEAQVIAEHQRVFTRDSNRRGKTVYDWRHYLAVVQRKPGALRNGAPFKTLPPGFLALQQQLLKKPGGDRDIVDILALVLHHDEQVIEQAINIAQSSGALTKQHVINCLNRLLDRRQPALASPPAALRLVNEPQANTHRYDHLRGKHHVR